MKYSVLIIQTGPRSFSVHSPDIDCCVATGSSVQDALDGFRQAAGDVRERGEEVPQPVTMVDTIEVS